MDGKYIRVLVPAPIGAPRGGEWAANAVVWIWHGVSWGARRLRRPATAPGQSDPDPVDRLHIPKRRQIA